MTKLCFISARNLGDAVLHADFLKRLQRAHPGYHLIVWTFVQARFLFEELPDTEIVCSEFPIGTTSRQFLKGGYRSFLATVRRIRRMKPDETLDVVGDWRERLALRLLGAPVNHSPEWETGHPFRHHIRMRSFRTGQPMTIPNTELNLYAAQTLMLRELAPNASVDSPPTPRPSLRAGQPLRIGLHPSASASFKLWPEDHWIELVTLMSKRFPGSTFTLFGAPNERAMLDTLGARLTAPYELFTASLREFKTKLSDIDLLFGLDSFSVHLAHSLGVPSIVLVGANDPRIFTPPSGIAVTHPGRCKFQPCGGRPVCIGTNFQYSCMIDITPAEASEAVPVQGASCATHASPSAVAL